MIIVQSHGQGSLYDFVLLHTITRDDQKVHGKVLLYLIAFIDCNENSQVETTIYSKLTEIDIRRTSTRCCREVTTLDPAHLYHWVASRC